MHARADRDKVSCEPRRSTAQEDEVARSRHVHVRRCAPVGFHAAFAKVALITSARSERRNGAMSACCFLPTVGSLSTYSRTRDAPGSCSGTGLYCTRDGLLLTVCYDNGPTKAQRNHEKLLVR